jgi:hypothetical protein
MSHETSSDGSHQSIDPNEGGGTAFIPAMKNALEYKDSPIAPLAFRAMINELPYQKRGQAVGYFAAEFPFKGVPIYDHYVTTGATRKSFTGLALVDKDRMIISLDPYENIREVDGHQKQIVENARITAHGAASISDLDARVVMPEGLVDIVYPHEVWRNKRQRRLGTVADEHCAIAKDQCEKLLADVIEDIRKAGRRLFGRKAKTEEAAGVLLQLQSTYRLIHEARALIEGGICAEAIQKDSAPDIRMINRTFEVLSAKIQALKERQSKK